MKKITFILIMSIAGFIACNRDEGSNTAVTQDDKVGILHNQILDSVLNDLWKEKVRLYQENSVKVLKSSSSRWEKNQVADLAYASMTGSLKNLVPDITDEAIEAHAPKDFFTVRVNSPFVESRSTVPQEAALTSFQQKYYEKLKRVLNENETTLERVLTKISDLEKSIKQNAPNDTEAELLFYATSVARHSAQYWQENAGKWATVLNSEISKIITTTPGDIEERTRGHVVDGIEPGYYPHPTDPAKYYVVTEEGLVIILDCPGGLHWNPTLCVCDWPDSADTPFSWGQLVSSDVGGAAGGAAGGAFFGGIGAGPGALVGGVSSSVGDAIGQLWSHIW